MPLAKDLRRILTPPVGCNIIGHNNNALTNFRYPGFNFHLAKYMHHLFYCLLAYRPQRQEETSLHAGSAIDTATQYLFCVCVCLFKLQFLGQNIYTDVDFPHGADKNMCDKKICDKTLYEKVHPRKRS